MIVPLGSIYDSEHLSLSVKCGFFYYQNRLAVILLGAILLIGGITSIIAITAPSIQYENPCLTYSPDDLASTISLECFRYIWRNCPQPIPDGYHGWWLRSPQGGQMVPCYPSLREDQCGAGSFRTISTYAYLCKLDYKGPM